ncbi:hypothetical protein [Saccharibacillus brassicae]|uniref:Uncharacterized protein n=1 Tax=Saccharibacillus brassicae TaxID=2583377 RepID=A0A4Y6V0D0_SACBS|nr:hypothetical protein [Saccharibacillus brassicae]QDH23479.1 hypothetical protein FFV09_23005 [Saccharibacillus brassicae]
MKFPMKGKQIDPQYIERVAQRVNATWHVTKSEVNAVLIAAIAELNPNLAKDDKVTHRTRKGLGEGKVERLSKSGRRAQVYWPESKNPWDRKHGGMYDVANLIKVEPAEP